MYKGFLSLASGDRQTTVMFHHRVRLLPWPLSYPAVRPTSQSLQLTGLVFRENAQSLGFNMATHTYEAD